jgi:hypothetical protein
MTEWAVAVNDGQEYLTQSNGLYDAVTVDAFNPFGDYAKAFFDDLDGELFDLFSRGTKVEWAYVEEGDNINDVAKFVTIEQGETRLIDDGESEIHKETTVEGELTIEGELTVTDTLFYNNADPTVDFIGFAVNDFEQEADGAEQLELEAYTFDQFLRGDEVSNDQTGNLLSEALEDVIKNDVPPIEWDASLVSIEDDVVLTQGYQGDNVEEFLLSVRKKSAGEIFGVTEELKFFFDLPEIERTSRDIANDQWVTHNINEEGGETKNQVVVSYDDGTQSVTVDNSSDQLQTQENLNANGPAQEGDSITRPEITDIDDAIKAGEQFLEDRQSTLTGPVTTFGLTDAAPGNVIGVDIDPRGIDGDFRIAENRTQWRSETNELTVVEKKGADSDILIEQSKTLDRVEARPRDNTVTPDRVTDTKPTAEFDVSISASGGVDNELFVDDGTTETIDTNQTNDAATIEGDLTVEADLTIEASTLSEAETRFVNGGRNRVRNALTDETIVQSLRIELSTDDSRPVRSDSSLSNTVVTKTPTVTTSPQAVTYSTATTAQGIQTVGVFDDTENTLLAVARLSSAVDNPSIDLPIAIADDTDQPKTVWTNTGLNTLRDVLASKGVDWPQEYAYGDDSTNPTVSDTSLGNQVVSQNLNDALIESLDTQTDWENQTPSFADDVPIGVVNGELKQLRATYFTEAEDLLDFAGNIVTDAGNLSSDEGIELSISNDFVEFQFSPDYRVPSGEWNADFYYNADNFSGTVKRYINGQEIESDTFSSSNATNSLEGSSDVGIELQPGNAYDYRVELDSVSSGSITIDTLQVVDSGDRFGGFNITRGGTFDSNSASFDAPEIYSDLQEVLLNTFNTAREIDQATVESTWNDTSNKQYIELSNDGNNFIRSSNNDTATASFNNLETGLDVRLGISRYDGGTLNTPTKGGFTQAVNVLNAFGNPDAITKENIGEAAVKAIIRDSAAVGETFAEAGLLDSNSDLLTRSLVPEFSKTSDQKVISGERLRFQNP